jgi:cytochrome P450
MNATVVLATRDDVEAALHSADLAPPSRPRDIAPGPTAELRDTMARFSSGAVQRQRRVEVDNAIAALSTSEARSCAARRTLLRLSGDPVDAVAEIAHHVPTEALADVLGVGAESEQLTTDTRLVAEVIGRGKPSSVASDEAAARLLHRFRAHPLGAVPVVSLLYQNYDATAALLAATIVCHHHGGARRGAVARTVRVASRDALVGGRRVRAGTTVKLDLEASGFEFGAGPHRCPGREIAQAIVDGAVGALAERGYRVLPDLVAVDDGRAVALPMEPR